MPSSAVVHKMKEYIKISHTSQSNLIRRRLQYWLVLVLLERWDFVFNNGEFCLIIIYVFVLVALFHLFLLMMTVIMFHIILDKHRIGFIISDVKVPIENWHILLRWFSCCECWSSHMESSENLASCEILVVTEDDTVSCCSRPTIPLLFPRKYKCAYSVIGHLCALLLSHVICSSDEKNAILVLNVDVTTNLKL